MGVYAPVICRRWVRTREKLPNRSLRVEAIIRVLKATAAPPASARTATLSPEPGNIPALATPADEIEEIMAESMGWKPIPVDSNGLLDGPKKSWPSVDAGLPPPKNASQRRPKTKSTATLPKVLRKLILGGELIAAISCLA